MFKPSNHEAAWYTGVRLVLKKKSTLANRVGVPMAPFVCPVQAGPEDDGTRIEAWPLTGYGAGINDATRQALELLGLHPGIDDPMDEDGDDELLI